MVEAWTSAFQSFFDGPYRDAVDTLDDEYPERRSLRVDWTDLDAEHPDVADTLFRQPDNVLDHASEALRTLDGVSAPSAQLRVHNLPEDRQFRVGKYRTRQLGNLISVTGKVVDLDGVQPYAEEAAFECRLCGTLTRFPQSYGDMVKPQECAGCEHGNPGFFFNRDQSHLVDLQKIVVIPPDSNLDEPPATIAFLKHDLCDTVGPGDRVTLNGIYETFDGQSEATLSTYIEVNAIDIEERTEIDAYGAAEIREFIMDAVEELITASDSFAADREAVVDHVTSEYGVRREEVADQVEHLVDENKLGADSGQLFDI